MARRRKGGIEGIAVAALVVLAGIGALIDWIGRHPEVLVLLALSGVAVVAVWFSLGRTQAAEQDRAVAAFQTTRHEQILADCRRLCGESKNASTRASRAALGLEQVDILERLGAMPGEQASSLRGFFRAVATVAPAHEAFAKSVAAGSERTRIKWLAETRRLVTQHGVTDDLLREAAATNPTTGAQLTLEEMHGTFVDHADTAAEVPPLTIRRTTTPSSSGLVITIGSPEASGGTEVSTGRWNPPGDTVSFAGRTLPGGMLWTGTGLSSVNAYGVEPALIDPELPVAASDPDNAGEAMPYWPSYARLDPRCRLAYLNWLAGGRTDAGIDVGYVFLFFYGLERRLLHDGADGGVTPEEASAIRAEIARLFEQHPKGSFRSYSRGLLDCIDARWPSADVVSAVRHGRYSDVVPLNVRVALGKRAAEGATIPAQLALDWIRTHPSPGLGSSLDRCAEEFDTLFLRRFDLTYPGGLVVKSNRARIEHRYRPASASFAGHDIRMTLDLPDPTQINGPWQRVHAVAETCCQALDPYRRLIARRPEAKSSPEAFALLPIDCTATESLAVAEIRRWAQQSLSSEALALADTAALLRRWNDAGGSISRPRPTAVAIAQLLDRWSIGIEPDTRFGGQAIQAEYPVVLFANPAPCPDAPTEVYAAAALTIQLCGAVAMADGQAHPDEIQHLDRHVSTSLELEPSERRRLDAHLRWTQAKPPSLSSLRRRLQELSGSERSAIGRLVVQLVTADGHVDPTEIKLLAKVYKVLDLDPGRIHADIHAAMVEDESEVDGPVTVRPGSVHSGFAIPPSIDRGGMIALDPARIQQRVAETARVTAMLDAIFVEDDDTRVPPSMADQVEAVSGLDEVHARFLRRLAAAPSWPRADVEALAAECALLPNGALETLNEAAFARADAPLCEGDDPVELDPDVLEVLLR